MALALNPDLAKSSAFSLISTTTAITVNKKMEKKKVDKNFLIIYQSIFFIFFYFPALTSTKAFAMGVG